MLLLSRITTDGPHNRKLPPLPRKYTANRAVLRDSLLESDSDSDNDNSASDNDNDNGNDKHDETVHTEKPLHISSIGENKTKEPEYSPNKSRRRRRFGMNNDDDDYDYDYESDDNSFLEKSSTSHKKSKQLKNDYYTVKSHIREIYSQQNLNVKNIESSKKVKSIWQAIIDKYSQYDEDNQGDIIDLSNFEIELNTGHVEKLRDADRTNIWDDEIRLEDSDGTKILTYQDTYDPSIDPLNIITPSRRATRQPTREHTRQTTRQPTRQPTRLPTRQNSPIRQRQVDSDSMFLLAPPKLTPRPTPKVSSVTHSSYKPHYTSSHTPRKEPLSNTKTPESLPKPIKPPSYLLPKKTPIALDEPDPISLLTPPDSKRRSSNPTPSYRRKFFTRRYYGRANNTSTPTKPFKVPKLPTSFHPTSPISTRYNESSSKSLSSQENVRISQMNLPLSEISSPEYFKKSIWSRFETARDSSVTRPNFDARNFENPFKKRDLTKPSKDSKSAHNISDFDVFSFTKSTPSPQKVQKTASLDLSNLNNQHQHTQPYQEPHQQPYQPPYQQPYQLPYYQQPYQQPYQPSYHHPFYQPYQQPYQQPFQQPFQHHYQPAPASVPIFPQEEMLEEPSSNSNSNIPSSNVDSVSSEITNPTPEEKEVIVVSDSEDDNESLYEDAMTLTDSSHDPINLLLPKKSSRVV